MCLGDVSIHTFTERVGMKQKYRTVLRCFYVKCQFDIEYVVEGFEEQACLDHQARMGHKRNKLMVYTELEKADGSMGPDVESVDLLCCGYFECRLYCEHIHENNTEEEARRRHQSEMGHKNNYTRIVTKPIRVKMLVDKLDVIRKLRASGDIVDMNYDEIMEQYMSDVMNRGQLSSELLARLGRVPWYPISIVGGYYWESDPCLLYTSPSPRDS